jgi:hypothetical protein
VLDTLLDGLQGRWFMERETVSLAFEAGLSRVDMGSVHVVRPQGFAAEPFFCDSHTDELDPGTLLAARTRTHTHHRTRTTAHKTRWLPHVKLEGD